MGFLQAKRALVTGIASQRSIASGIAEAMHREGAELASPTRTTSSRRASRRPRGVGSDIVLPLDVADDARSHAASSNSASAGTASTSSSICIAYAPREAIEGEFLDGLTRENFAIAHDISAYFAGGACQGARPMMDRPQWRGADPELPGRRARAEELQRDGRGQGQPRGDGALPRAELGPEGTRVNAISAGPIRTLAASGVANFRQMLSQFEAACPAASRGHHRGRRQCRRVPVLGPRLGA
jgi:enoyl-[acyl-carrier protein] reductase I